MLSESDLQIADILLSTGSATVSRVIRGATGSNYSHAAIYIGNGNIIEAVGDGVQLKSLKRAMTDDSLVSVYRHSNLSSGQGQKAVAYARLQVGKPYDSAGAAGGGLTSGRGIVIAVFLGPLLAGIGFAADIRNRNNPEAAFYCSELVALSFAHAGVSLGSGAASTTPEDIKKSRQTNYIGELKK